MNIGTDLVKKLRDMTGVSVMECRKALEEAAGDIERAKEVLLKKSAGMAAKKGDRTLGAGIVASYIHTTGTVGVMIELLSETDFVAQNEEFKKLARDIAMQIAATDPQAIRKEDVKDGSEALLDQSFIKNPQLTIANLIESAIQKFGERIEIGKFVRYSI